MIYCYEKILNSKRFSLQETGVSAELQTGFQTDPPNLVDWEHSSLVIDATAFAPEEDKYIFLLKQERV